MEYFNYHYSICLAFIDEVALFKIMQGYDVIHLYLSNNDYMEFCSLNRNYIEFQFDKPIYYAPTRLGHVKICIYPNEDPVTHRVGISLGPE